MRESSVSSRLRPSDATLIRLTGLAFTLEHIATSSRYGFHRDELLTYSNARHLDRRYVVYPPLTAWLARAELAIFGANLIGFRFFAAIAMGLLIVLTGLTARALGGSRTAMLVAAVAAAIEGPVVFSGSFLSYMTFDLLWWVAVAWSTVCLLRSQTPAGGSASASLSGSAYSPNTPWPSLLPACSAGCSSAEPPLPAPPMVLVRCRRLRCPHSACTPLATSSPLCGPRLDAEHSLPRCQLGPCRILHSEPVLASHQPCHCSHLAGRPLVSLRNSRRKALPHGRLDVCHPTVPLPCGPRPRLRSQPRLPDAHGSRCRLGRTTTYLAQSALVVRRYS